MLQRCPSYQTPSWLIALLLVLGVALDFQTTFQKTSQPDQSSVYEIARNVGWNVLLGSPRSTSMTE